MTHKFIVFPGVAIFTATFAWIASGMPARAADTAPAMRFWTEVAAPAHVAKAQSMPDFVDLAAKLSPAVVNISTDEPGEPAEAGDPSPEDSPHFPLMPPHSHPFEDFGGAPHSKALGSGFIITKDG